MTTVTPLFIKAPFSPGKLERGRTVPALKSAAEPCWDHDAPAPCPKCRDDALWYAKMREAEELESAAKLARKSNLDGDPHIERIAAEWDRSASQIRGWLERTADEEARELDSLCGVGGELLR